MDHVGKLAQASLTKDAATHTTQDHRISRASKDISLSNGTISRIFKIFKTDYGAAWASQFTTREALDEAKTRWARKLGHLTVKQLNYGLDHMAENHKRFPPTLPEFLDLCMSEERKPACAAHREFPGLEHKIPTADQETGRKYLDEIRRDLGMPEHENR